MFEFGKNVHLANFLNFLLGNDLTKFLFPYALLVLLEVVILDTIERMIGKKCKATTSMGFCLMESTKFYVSLNVTILKGENITMEEEDQGGRPSRHQAG
jgi:hypothetical protein